MAIVVLNSVGSDMRLDCDRSHPGGNDSVGVIRIDAKWRKLVDGKRNGTRTVRTDPSRSVEPADRNVRIKTKN